MSYDTHRPYVNKFVIALFQNDFWCHIQWTAQNLAVGRVFFEEASKPEVSQLHLWKYVLAFRLLLIYGQQNVFWLNIAVHHTMFVQVIQSIHDFF